MFLQSDDHTSMFYPRGTINYTNVFTSHSEPKVCICLCSASNYPRIWYTTARNRMHITDVITDVITVYTMCNLDDVEMYKCWNPSTTKEKIYFSTRCEIDPVFYQTCGVGNSFGYGDERTFCGFYVTWNNNLYSLPCNIGRTCLFYLDNDNTLGNLDDVEMYKCWNSLLYYRYHATTTKQKIYFSTRCELDSVFYQTYCFENNFGYGDENRFCEFYTSNLIASYTIKHTRYYSLHHTLHHTLYHTLHHTFYHTLHHTLYVSCDTGYRTVIDWCVTCGTRRCIVSVA